MTKDSDIGETMCLVREIRAGGVLHSYCRTRSAAPTSQNRRLIAALLNAITSIAAELDPTGRSDLWRRNAVVREALAILELPSRARWRRLARVFVPDPELASPPANAANR